MSVLATRLYVIMTLEHKMQKVHQSFPEITFYKNSIKIGRDFEKSTSVAN